MCHQPERIEFMNQKFSISCTAQGVLCLVVSFMLLRTSLFSEGAFLLFPLSILCFAAASLCRALGKRFRAQKHLNLFLSVDFLFWMVLCLFLPSHRKFSFVALLLAITAVIPPGCSISFVLCYIKAVFGNPVYQEYIAECYVRGEDVSKSPEKAFKWFRKAALKEDSEAQYFLGVFYEFGIGVEADLSEAMKWYWEAVQKGHPAAIARINRPLIQKNSQPPKNLL